MTPADILMALSTMVSSRAVPTFQELARNAAALADGTRHFIVTGRVPGDDDDTVEHVVCVGDDDPWVKFVEQVLYDGNIVSPAEYDGEEIGRSCGAALPSDWQQREMDGRCDNPHKEWAYHGHTFEILGPPLT